MAVARFAGSSAGRWSTFHARRPIARIASTGSSPLSWTTSGSKARERVADLVGRGVGRDRHDQRPAGPGPGAPGQPRERGRLVESERPGRAGDDVQPDRIGTGGDRGEDPVGVGDAADLHERPAGDVGRIVRGRPRRHEGPGGSGRVRRADERLTDQRRVEPERAPARHRGRFTDPRLGDDQPIVGDALAQPGGALDVDLERPQVPVVEPDEARPAGERLVQLPFVVRLDQRLEADLDGALHEPGEPLRRVEHREEQDEVGAGRAEERQLDLLDHEVLGEDRDGDRRADGAQVVDRPTEPVRLAQHRDGGRAAGLVRPGAGDDVLSGAGDPPGRRRGALDLGDEVQARGRQAPGDGARRRSGPAGLDDGARVEAGGLGQDVGAPSSRDLLDHVRRDACRRASGAPSRSCR